MRKTQKSMTDESGSELLSYISSSHVTNLFSLPQYANLQGTQESHRKQR